MSPSRPTPHRLGRDRREIAVAVLCAAGVLLVTALLLWVLAPGSDDTAPSTPPISLPTPGSDVPVPETAIPDTGNGDTPVPDAGETSTTLVGG